jgi:cyclic pyranopterin phosphate synthase
MTRARGDTLSLRISVTNGCNLRCRYCAPSEAPGMPAEVLPAADVLRFVRLVKTHVRIDKIHLTGGEPLEHPDLLEIVRGLTREAPSDLCLTTNGQRLVEKAGDLAGAGLSRVTVNLASLREERFRSITRGGELSRTLRGIEAARQAGLDPVQVNVTVVRAANDDELLDFVRFGMEHDCPVRFIELMPVGPAASRHDEWFVSSAEVRRRLSALFDLAPLGRARGSSARRFRASDGNGRRGVVGFISPVTEPFCGDCTRVRLLASGRLLGCLAHGEGTDVLSLLRAGEETAVVEAVRRAARQRRGDRPFVTQDAMVRIGG